MWNAHRSATFSIEIYLRTSNLDYTRYILSGWPVNEILSSQPQHVDRIVDQGEHEGG
jgi:hypothetical protein